MMTKNLNNKGFSLIELMVVVAIIGILSAIGIPQYSKFQAKSRQSEAKSSLGTLFTAEKSFQIEWSFYTRDVVSAGFGIEGANLRYDVGFPGVAGPSAGAYPANAPVEQAARQFASGGTPAPAFLVAPPAGAVYVPSIGNGAAAGVHYAAANFRAIAWGSPNSGAVVCTSGAGATQCDEWTIDQGKTLTSPQNGIW